MQCYQSAEKVFVSQKHAIKVMSGFEVFKGMELQDVTRVLMQYSPAQTHDAMFHIYLFLL